jgi:hypothetical protein
MTSYSYRCCTASGTTSRDGLSKRAASVLKSCMDLGQSTTCDSDFLAPGMACVWSLVESLWELRTERTAVRNN